jgi:hypothetical protein
MRLNKNLLKIMWAHPQATQGVGLFIATPLFPQKPSFGGVSIAIPCAADAFVKKQNRIFLLILKGFKVYRKQHLPPPRCRRHRTIQSNQIKTAL